MFLCNIKVYKMYILNAYHVLLLIHFKWVGEMGLLHISGVGEMGVGKMGQMIGEMGVGEIENKPKKWPLKPSYVVPHVLRTLNPRGL